jgi:Lon protease-like protein
MEIAEVPLFPLKTVLFPGGPLPLRVFEPRYLDMISYCLRHEHGFGVVLIRQGHEVGPAEIHDVGTMADIVDWYQGSDGLLGVTAQGRGRFRVASVRVRANGLQVGQIEPIRPEPSQPLPAVFAPMARVLSEIIDDLGSHYQDLDKHYNDASWVGYRFAEILPVPATQRQAYLEMNDPVQRLEMLRPFLKFNKGEN